MFKYFLFVFLFILLSAGPVSAQRKYSFFYGQVLDQVTGKGIPDVNIRFEGSVKGTSTNSKGEFSFYIDTLPILMVVSHLGYETRNLLLDKTSFSLSIDLQPKIQQLKEIVISASRNAESVFRNQYVNVLDYEIDTGKIFLLITDIRSSRSALICRTPEGDTLAWNNTLTNNPKQLFLDCLGNIHILTADSAYQVFSDAKRLRLIYPVSLKKFNDILRNCVFSTPGFLFIRKLEQNGQTVSYFKVNRSNNQRQMLITIEDSLKTKMLRRNPHDNDLLMQTVQPTGRDDFVNWSYVHKILYRPVSTALCKIGNFICIFNAVEKTLEFYRMDGNYAFKLLIMIHKIDEGSWLKNILVDEERPKVYTTFIRNGYYFLYALDLNTGELKKALSLVHLYPENLQIHDGYVYYLYHEAGSGDNRELFRQPVF